MELGIPGEVLWTAEGDCDGDGLSDLVASYRRGSGPTAEKFFAVFFRSQSGLPKRPSTAFKAPKNAAVFDLGDALGDGADEIVYLAPSGVFAQAFKKRRPTRPTRVIKTRTLVGRPEEEDLVHWDFFRKPTPRDPPTVLVPTRRAVELYRRDGAVFRRWSTVRPRMLSFYDAERDSYRSSRRGGRSGRDYSFRATTIVPQLTFGDQNGDGRTDLVATFEDRVEVFAARTNGTLTSSASHRRWLRLETPEERTSRDVDLEVQVVDLNGDGRLDLSATKIGGGLTNMWTETRWYLALDGGGFSSRPASRRREDGFAALVQYRDLDGDGRAEFIQPHSSVSLLGLSRVLLSSSMTIDFRVFGGVADAKVFAKSPRSEFESNLGLDFTVGGALRGSYPVFGADFDGDGHEDVVVTRGPETMVLLRGLGKGRFDDDVFRTLSAPATRHTRLLDGGRAPELLLIYPNRPEQRGKLIVFRAER